MPRFSPIQTNFTAGELSPRLEGRVDFAKYYNGAKTLENFNVLPHGGIKRRVGTHFVAEAENSAEASRLIPFEFNTEQAYIIEMGNLYFRFFKDNGSIGEATKTITGITRANPAVVTISTHGYENGDEVDIAAVVGMTEVNGKRFIVANKTTNTFELSGINSSAFTAYSSGGTAARVYEVVTPYVEADLNEIQFAQSADTMFITHPSYAPRKLTRTAHNNWTLTEITFIDGPYLDQNTTATTLSCNATSGSSRTLTASTAIFNANHVGAIFSFLDGYVTCTAFVDTTHLTVTVTDDITGTGTTTEWSEGAWSTHQGFPACVTFFEERLMFAGSTNNPQTLWGSVSGDFENFKAGTGASDAFIFTIASNKVNVIRWLAPASRLCIGTAGGEFTVTSTSDAPLSPTNVSIKRQTTFGSTTIMPIQIRNVVLFVQRAGRKLREFFFRFEQDAFVAPDITILSEHVSDPSIIALDYKQENDSQLWAVRSDGQLLAMTYERDQDVVAWSRHIVGGNFGECTITVTDFANIAVGTTLILTKADGTTVTFTSESVGSSSPTSSTGFRPNTNNNTTADNIFTTINAHADFTVANPAANVVTVYETLKSGNGKLTIESSDTTRLATTDEGIAVVESVASIPISDRDQTWVIVKRTINGTTKRYVEYLDEKQWATATNVQWPEMNTDSGLTYSGTAISVISNLEHLEGQTVKIIADGALHPNKRVSGGAITLDRAATEIEIGLAYTSTLQTLRPDSQQQQATLQGKSKRWNEVIARFHQTLGGKINDDIIYYRTSADKMGKAPSLFTGDKRVCNLGYDKDGHITVEQTEPLPIQVLSITGTLGAYD